MPSLQIQPVRIGNLELVDASDATESENLLAGARANSGHARWAGLRTDEDPFRDALLCAQDEERRDSAKHLWMEAVLAGEPGLTFQEFVGAGRDVRYEADWNRSLYSITATVLQNGAGHGQLTITNMDLEVDTASRVEASGFAQYYSDPGDPVVMMAEMGRVLFHLFRNEIDLKDGRVLDLLQFNWPASRHDIGFWADDRYLMTSVFARLERAGVRKLDQPSPEHVHKRVRRLDAPRQPDGGDVIEPAPEPDPEVI